MLRLQQRHSFTLGLKRSLPSTDVLLTKTYTIQHPTTRFLAVHVLIRIHILISSFTQA
ncbi:hypothetical protein NEUTE1DRAFT_116101 [Neurospora tetrasperma FGSC 2508]|uniref:Uncharacterized protein n=1 Tax=Neurospora tetrasperma (strain FGSC 2508 / ATCC MYA-4615 / P0657) TaxID=510951 RepID=F8MDF0_NEUT8|nr:uncharacterized protein NEUTE1DRAFT_116101 [Neurospora tetrasperma FGSC 2508]EGO61441.1 hypothetical protein NEUTE1DRAFT_116101 [Neurospora tetrasperma FGSC 2508]EGZ74531.1 hypothetical protein NEUTE2DRAFT_143381 [Neurospora tetrasperma FGSC 2509]